MVNLMFLDSSGILDDDSKEDKALQAKLRKFEYKLRFLKERGILDSETYSKLRRFDDLRSSLFERPQNVIERSVSKEEAERDNDEIVLEGVQALIVAFGKFTKEKLARE